MNETQQSSPTHSLIKNSYKFKRNTRNRISYLIRICWILYTIYTYIFSVVDSVFRLYVCLLCTRARHIRCYMILIQYNLCYASSLFDTRKKNNQRKKGEKNSIEKQLFVYCHSKC